MHVADPPDCAMIMFLQVAKPDSKKASKKAMEGSTGIEEELPKKQRVKTLPQMPWRLGQRRQRNQAAALRMKRRRL